MASGAFFEGIEFSRPDDAAFRRLHLSLERGGTETRDVFPVDMPATLILQQVFRSMGAGCRLAAPPSDIFEVSAGQGGDLVTRCSHVPYHEWHGSKRVR